MFIHPGNRPCPSAVAGPLVFVCLTFTACGGPGYELAPVSGRVTINGTPTEGVQLNFQPRSGGSAGPNVGPGSYAVTDAQGRFELKTVDKDLPGAVPGRHLVRMVPANGQNLAIEYSVVSQIRLPKSAMDGSLEYVVPEDGTDAADFDLQLR